MASRTEYKTLVYWVKEREAIRVRKESSEKGRSFRSQTGGEAYPSLTDNPILAGTRFCNVRREDDRVTVWVRNEIRNRFADHEHLWFMLCMARMINWPDTLAEMIQTAGAWPDNTKFTPSGAMKVLSRRREAKKKVWTGAYLIPSGSVKGEPREVHICQRVLGEVWRNREVFGTMLSNSKCTIEGFHRYLSTNYLGWGQFMAYQVAVDLRFTHYLSVASDRSDWAAAGPGTLRGLHRVHGRPLNDRLSQDQARDEMRKLYETIQGDSGVEMDFSDIPNILCETDKYIRLRNGEGKTRAKYVPGRGF